MALEQATCPGRRRKGLFTIGMAHPEYGQSSSLVKRLAYLSTAAGWDQRSTDMAGMRGRGT
jgi:hypothetical protein